VYVNWIALVQYNMKILIYYSTNTVCPTYTVFGKPTLKIGYQHDTPDMTYNTISFFTNHNSHYCIYRIYFEDKGYHTQQSRPYNNS